MTECKGAYVRFSKMKAADAILEPKDTASPQNPQGGGRRTLTIITLVARVFSRKRDFSFLS